MNEHYIERYWRDATPQDAIKEPPMVARFRNHKDSEWYISNLFGIDRAVISGCLWCGGAAAYHQCQVYDAPDPGEGWRLIDVDKDKPQEGDEIWAGHEWSPMEYFKVFCLPNHYRRRIEQPKPKYEPFKWEDREQLRGRWIGSNDGRWERFIAYIYKDSERFYANGISTESLLEEYHFLDTGEPVGRRVE